MGTAALLLDEQTTLMQCCRHTCSMLLMKVCGCAHLGVSMMKAIIVGKPEAKASVMMAPDADHVKISIWPGVSTITYLRGGSRCFSQRLMTCSSNSCYIIQIWLYDWQLGRQATSCTHLRLDSICMIATYCNASADKGVLSGVLSGT